MATSLDTREESFLHRQGSTSHQDVSGQTGFKTPGIENGREIPRHGAPMSERRVLRDGGYKGGFEAAASVPESSGRCPREGGGVCISGATGQAGKVFK